MFKQKIKRKRSLNMTEKQIAGLCLLHTVEWLIDKKVSDVMSFRKSKGIYA